jgi:hypothetical protein
LTSSNQSNRELGDFSAYKKNGIIMDYPKDWREQMEKERQEKELKS